MPFSIDEFKGYVAGGGGILKNNRFAVRMTVPKALRGKSISGSSVTDMNRGIEFFAERVTLPGMSLQTSEMRRLGIGNLEKGFWGAAFTDCDITFRIDQKSKLWNYFQIWMNTIYNFSDGNNNNYELEYKDNIVAPVSIFVYNEQTPKKPTITVDLIDAYPVSISDVSLNWGDQDFVRLNVRFNFRTWQERDTSSFIPQI